MKFVYNVPLSYNTVDGIHACRSRVVHGKPVYLLQNSTSDSNCPPLSTPTATPRRLALIVNKVVGDGVPAPVDSYYEFSSSKVGQAGGRRGCRPV